MASDDAGKAAIESLIGKEFGGRELRVDTATDRN